MKKLLVFLSFLFIVTMSSSVFAQSADTKLPYPGLLPDSPIYFLKSIRDKVKGFFIFSEDGKALYALTLADKRLSEAKALSDKGEDELASVTAEEAGKESESAQEHLTKAESEGKDVTAIVAKLAANSARQQAVLAKVLEKVPEQAKAAIERAMEMSKKGLSRAQERQTKETGTPSGTLGKPTKLPGGKP